MPDNRKAHRINDPGLQPERTSLAWFRTLLGYGALMALAIKNHWYQAGIAFWISLLILTVVVVNLWRYTHNRNRMDVTRCDFSKLRTVYDKFFIALGVIFLALFFAATHLQKILLFVKEIP